MEGKLEQVCVIYDNDEQYGRRLMSSISKRKNLSFGIQLFTEEKELYSYLDKNEPEVVVVSEQDYSNELEKKYNGKVLVLTESEAGSVDEISSTLHETVLVYKFQPVDNILREIIHCTGGFKECGEAELIGVFSPVYEPLRSGFALCLARTLSESCRTLYVNLEEFSGLEELLPQNEEETFSDALYDYRKHGKITEQIKKVICTHNGVDYIPPIQYAQDISCIETEETADFISALAKVCGYQKVVADISSAVREQWKMILKCTNIYMPVKEDYLSLRKLEGFEKYLLMSGMEHIWNHIKKVNIPQKCGSIHKDYMNCREGEMMNGFVRSILAE